MWPLLLALTADIAVVPAGPARVGCSGAACAPTEIPEVRVDRTPVPAAQLAACRTAHACTPRVRADETCPTGVSPVSGGTTMEAWARTSWDEAVEYCAWQGGRVATEAEWARGRTAGLTFAPTEWVDGWWTAAGGWSGGPMGGFAARSRLLLTPGSTPAGDARTGAPADSGDGYGWRCAYGPAPLSSFSSTPTRPGEPCDEPGTSPGG